jgi:hypothetical protein
MICTERMHVDPAYRERLRACGLDSVSHILAQTTGRISAWSRTTDTIYVPGPAGCPGFYVKRHFFPTWSKRLRGALRGTFFGEHRGESEYRVLERLRAVGITAVRPVAFGGRRIAHFLAACFLITEEVPQTENLTTFALSVASGRRQLTRTARRALIAGLANQIADMHAAGCAHGNLFWRNILVRYGPDGRPEFFLLDAQPLQSWKRLARGSAGWMHDLAQVTVSALPFTTRAERLRFMGHYLRGTRPAPALKARFQQIENLAASWKTHEDRRIRMTHRFDEWNRLLQDEAARGAPGITLPQPAECGP